MFSVSIIDGGEIWRMVDGAPLLNLEGEIDESIFYNSPVVYIYFPPF